MADTDPPGAIAHALSLLDVPGQRDAPVGWLDPLGGNDSPTGPLRVLTRRAPTTLAGSAPETAAKPRFRAAGRSTVHTHQTARSLGTSATRGER